MKRVSPQDNNDTSSSSLPLIVCSSAIRWLDRGTSLKESKGSLGSQTPTKKIQQQQQFKHHVRYLEARIPRREGRNGILGTLMN